MNLKHILITIVLTFSLIGCYSTQSVTKENDSDGLKKMMNSFMGISKKELLMKWGSPDSVTSDGDNGEIITFIDLKRAYLQNLGYVTVTHKYMFYSNSDKIIYHWNYERDGRQGY